MPNPFLYIHTVLFQTIQFSISTLFSSIYPIDRAYPVLSLRPKVELEAIAIEGVLRIIQNSRITGASPSYCLMSYPGHSLGKSSPSAKRQSVYSTAPADCGSYKSSGNIEFHIATAICRHQERKWTVWYTLKDTRRGTHAHACIHIHTHLYTYIHAEIVCVNCKSSSWFIIFSCHQNGYPWPSLTTPPYHSSFSAGPQVYDPYPLRAALSRF